MGVDYLPLQGYKETCRQTSNDANEGGREGWSRAIERDNGNTGKELTERELLRDGAHTTGLFVGPSPSLA